VKIGTGASRRAKRTSSDDLGTLVLNGLDQSLLSCAVQFDAFGKLLCIFLVRLVLLTQFDDWCLFWRLNMLRETKGKTCYAQE
jgi:hypothetical protein